MKDIALAIMIVGLSFNSTYRIKNNLGIDEIEALAAVIGVIILFT